MTLDDLLKNSIVKTVWIWLPFHALIRLVKEYRQQKK